MAAGRRRRGCAPASRRRRCIRLRRARATSPTLSGRCGSLPARRPTWPCSRTTCGDGRCRCTSRLARRRTSGAQPPDEPSRRRPDAPARLDIGFEGGVPRRLNGVPMPLVELLEQPRHDCRRAWRRSQSTCSCRTRRRGREMAKHRRRPCCDARRSRRCSRGPAHRLPPRRARSATWYAIAHRRRADWLGPTRRCRSTPPRNRLSRRCVAGTGSHRAGSRRVPCRCAVLGITASSLPLPRSHDTLVWPIRECPRSGRVRLGRVVCLRLSPVRRRCRGQPRVVRGAAVRVSCRPTSSRRSTGADEIAGARPQPIPASCRARRGRALVRRAPARRARRCDGQASAYRPFAQRAGRARSAAVPASPHPRVQHWSRASSPRCAEQAERAGRSRVPAYTHLRRAQPVLEAHYWLAHASAFRRDSTGSRWTPRGRRAAAGIGRHRRQLVRHRRRVPRTPAWLLAHRGQQHGHGGRPRLRVELPPCRAPW